MKQNGTSSRSYQRRLADLTKKLAVVTASAAFKNEVNEKEIWRLEQEVKHAASDAAALNEATAGKVRESALIEGWNALRSGNYQSGKPISIQQLAGIIRSLQGVLIERIG